MYVELAKTQLIHEETIKEDEELELAKFVLACHGAQTTRECL